MQTIQCIRLPTVAPVRRACAPTRARTVRVLATDNNTTNTPTTTEASPASTSQATVFYGGQAYSEPEWKKAVAEGTVGNAAPTTGAFSQESAPQLSELMAFNGAPELINGRLAMLGVVAAIGAELASGTSVLQQLTQEPTLVFLTFLLISAASLIPLMNGGDAKDEKFGPFQPGAEMLNGRAAMLGMASLLIIEAVRGGQALF